MNTTNVELLGTIRVVVPVTFSGRCLDEEALQDIARRAYRLTVNGGPATIHTESSIPAPIKLANRPGLGPLDIIGDIIAEYYQVKPGLNWCRNNGYQITDSEIMLLAIRNTLVRLGYTVVELGNEQEPMTAIADSRDSAF